MPRRTLSSSNPHTKTGASKAVLLVKAAPQASEAHGETVCVAALDEYGLWHRLYPVNFRDLTKDRRFSRWDQISFKWRLPEVAKDRRNESKRVFQDSIEIIGDLKRTERERYLRKAIIDSPAEVYNNGGSLALIRPINPRFSYRPRSDEEIARVRAGYESINASPDLFGTTDIVPREAAPFEFFYDYTTADGSHHMRCHDWETEQTFLNWSRNYGEEAALNRMAKVFGEDYPRKGMLLALGTHGQRNWQWMIIGVLRVDESSQESFL